MTNTDAFRLTTNEIKEEIERLTEEQGNALRTATYLGMTVESTKEYDERGSRISSLLHELDRRNERAA